MLDDADFRFLLRVQDEGAEVIEVWYLCLVVFAVSMVGLGGRFRRRALELELAVVKMERDHYKSLASRDAVPGQGASAKYETDHSPDRTQSDSPSD